MMIKIPGAQCCGCDMYLDTDDEDFAKLAASALEELRETAFSPRSIELKAKGQVAEFKERIGAK